jgi:hypothetical protein
VTSIVTAWGLERVRDDAALLTSELVSNAVRAAGIASAAPRWSDPDHLALIRLRLIVDPEDEGGRGLLIVAGLSKQWNYSRLAEGGKWVWTVRHDLDSGLTLLSRVGQIVELTRASPRCRRRRGG